METSRSYGDACGVAQGLDLVGERWALLVVRELVFGPRRFTDLRAGLSGASANVLSQRLRELERSGIVRRRTLAPPAGSRVYELTDWGRELEPIVVGLGSWAVASPSFRSEGVLSVVSALLTLRTFFSSPDLGWRATFELHLGADTHTARVVDGRVRIEAGPASGPDAVIETDPRTFVDLLGSEQPLRDSIDSGRLRVNGDIAAVLRLFGGVRIPQPV